jgi:hypothetical protein
MIVMGTPGVLFSICANLSFLRKATSTIATLCRRILPVELIHFFLGNDQISGRFYFSLVSGDLKGELRSPDGLHLSTGDLSLVYEYMDECSGLSEQQHHKLFQEG